MSALENSGRCLFEGTVSKHRDHPIRRIKFARDSTFKNDFCDLHVLAGVRMDDGSDAIAWSKTLPRSDSSSGSNTTPWGDDIDATSLSMRAGQAEIPTAVCSGQGRKRTPKGRIALKQKARG